MSFLSFPEKLSQLPVILPILGILDSIIHGKIFAVAKRFEKTAKLFHRETKAIYGISATIVATNNEVYKVVDLQLNYSLAQEPLEK